MNSDQLRIILLGALTLFLFPLLGFLLYWLIEGEYISILTIFKSEFNFGIQLLIGSLYGLGAGVVAWELIRSKFMNPVLEKYGQVVKSLNLSWVVIVFLSFSAGVGEEFFFRGVLQDYLGIVITAIIFVLIHGYLNPFDKIIFVYGLMMTVIIIGVGFIDKYIGLTSAMVAHMVIDVILFYKLSNTDLLQDPFFIKQDADFSENNQ